MNATATASTGVEQLDDALGGLFWGDNVVWEIEDGESLDPFVDALVGVRAQFSNAAFVTLTEEPGAIRAAHPGFDVLDARAGTQLARPRPLLTAARAFAQKAPRALLVFDSLDAMSDRWNRRTAQRFFTRACPTLLDSWAIAYWSLTPGRHSPLAIPARARAPAAPPARIATATSWPALSPHRAAHAAGRNPARGPRG